MDILDTLRGAEIIAASSRCDEAIEQAFIGHVERVKAALQLPDHRAQIDRRNHISVAAQGDLLPGEEFVAASWTYVVYGGPVGYNLVPILIGTVVRETNHSLLSVVDRSGPTPVLYESKFDTRDYVTEPVHT